jgi:dihydroorotase
MVAVVVFQIDGMVDEGTVLDIAAADDFHHHLRDVPVLRDVLVHAQTNFGRIVL